MAKGRRLGDLVVEMGILTKTEVEKAVAYQSDKNIRLSKAMVDLGLLSDVKLVEILSEKYGLPIKAVEGLEVNTAVFDIVPVSMIREYRIFPFNYTETKLQVLMDDTVNLIMVDEIARLVKREVEVYLVREVEYERLLDKYVNDTKILEDLTDLAYTERLNQAYDVTTDTENSPVSKAVNRYLKQGYLSAASDIHFDITDKELLVRYRIDGDLRVVQKVPKSSADFIVARLKLMAGLNTTETRVPQDGSMQIAVNSRVIDLRMSVVPAMYGEKIVIRLLDNEKNIRGLDSVGFSDRNLKSLERMIKNPIGLILVTGPTGSGKSTLLYTFIHQVLSETKNIITIEDPVEYKLPSITQISVNQATGLTFPTGLRAILRQDPDIILVGEIRDEITAEIAVKASNTGHLVFSTLHTNSAVSSVTRLTEMGVAHYLVAGSAIGVINQRLVRRLCKDCKEEYTSTEQDEHRAFYGFDKDTHYKMYKPVGCTACNGVGYSGRLPIHEVLVVDEAVKYLINERKTMREIEDAAIERGMVTLKQDGIDKVMQGLTTLAELRKHVV